MAYIVCLASLLMCISNRSRGSCPLVPAMSPSLTSNDASRLHPFSINSVHSRVLPLFDRHEAIVLGFAEFAIARPEMTSATL